MSGLLGFSFEVKKNVSFILKNEEDTFFSLSSLSATLELSHLNSSSLVYYTAYVNV